MALLVEGYNHRSPQNTRVHKRVLNLVNFEVQKVQKPDVFDLETHSA